LQSLGALSAVATVTAAITILTAKPLTAEERMQHRREFFGIANPCLTGGPAKAQELLEHGAPTVALDHIHRYVAQCDASAALQMLPIRFLVHRTLGDHAAMVDDTKLALATQPQDEFFQFWHLAALEEAGRNVEAATQLRIFAMRGQAPAWDSDFRLREAQERLSAHKGFAGLSARMAAYYAHNEDACTGAAVHRRSQEWFPDDLPYAARYERALQRHCNGEPSHPALAIFWQPR